MMVDIVPADEIHVRELAPKLRKIDEEESQRAVGRPASWELRTSYTRSCRSWAVLKDGHCVAMFGVAPETSPKPYYGIPWLMASDEWDCGVGLAVCRHRRQYMPELCRGFRVLQNAVMATNERAIKFLHWLGFDFGKPFQVNGENSEFVPFWGTREGLCAASGRRLSSKP